MKKIILLCISCVIATFLRISLLDVYNSIYMSFIVNLVGSIAFVLVVKHLKTQYKDIITIGFLGTFTSYSLVFLDIKNTIQPITLIFYITLTFIIIPLFSLFVLKRGDKLWW